MNMSKKLLFFSLILALSLAAKGRSSYCSSKTDSKTCGPSGGSTWEQADSMTFSIVDCSLVTYPLTGIYDTLCNSCPQIQGAFYVSSDQTKCVQNPSIVGDEVDCFKNGSCQDCGSLTNAFSWKTNDSMDKCQVESCLAGPLPPSSATENFCLSCGKGKKYVNSYGTGCANPTGGKCDRKTDWTDADCAVCNANGSDSGKVKASADKTSCIAPPVSANTSSVIISTVTALAFLGTYLLL